MTDFRVDATLAEANYECELDWDENKKAWSVSERKAGFGKRWIQNLDPSPDDLEALLHFFRIDLKKVSFQVLSLLSPAELVLIHHHTNQALSIYAIPCEDCGKHWHVFRWEENRNIWLIYGRNCDFSWKRGDILSEHEIDILGRLRGFTENPTRPPSG